MNRTRLFYSPRHREQLEEATNALFEAGGTYPPRDATSKGAASYLRLDDGSAYSRYVAFHDDRIVGHVAVVPPGWSLLKPHLQDGRYAEISRLFVLPEAAGQGLGEALMKRALEYVDAFGPGTVLSVFPSLSPAASAMYLKFGFTVVEELAPEESEAPGELVHIMKRPPRDVIRYLSD